MPPTTRGFTGRGASSPSGPEASRLPPGQHLEAGFPVLSLGPTPHVPLDRWRLTLKVGPRPVRQWTWEEFGALPRTRWTRDIHCVTTWSKFDTGWEGVTFDDLLVAAGVEAPTSHVLAHSADGYSTNVPLADLRGQAMVAVLFDGKPLAPDHGGPARLLVPQLYFWKSAKWLTGLQFTKREELGFWELRGYHRRGDPFREERYTDD